LAKTKAYPYQELDFLMEEIAGIEADLEELERERDELSQQRGSSPTAEQTLADAIFDLVNKLEEYEGAAADLRAKLRKEAKTPRLALLITGNAYKDRDQEIIKQAAFEEMVESCWKEGAYVAEHPLLFWHRGDPIGTIVYSEMYGPFLVEVAKELEDRSINVADPSDPPLVTTVKQIWDIMEREPIDWGASYEFLFKEGDQDDSTYDAILKTETSVLPRDMAANGFTLCAVIPKED
jgi:hypothetical protein